MSEVQTRPPPRGRGSARGGRGGFSSRGGRGGNRTAKSDLENVQPSYEDEGELGQLKKKYSTSLPMIKELFPDWTDEDLVFALEDANGDLENAIERITEGNVSQWGEVKKKTDRSRPKAKEAQPAQTEPAPAPAARGGRGRGGFDTRGRARGDRGRGGRGGRAGAHVNGTRTEKTTTAASEATVPDAWPTQEPVDEAKPAAAAPAAATEASEKPAAPKSSIIPEGSKKGWASLFAPPPPQKKAPVPSAAPEKPAQKPVDEKPAKQPTHTETTAQAQAPAPAQQPTEVPPPQVSVTSTDELTKSNLEQVPDASPPAPATTVASTGASTQDQASVLSAVTAAQPRPAIPGYAGNQYKAAAAAAPGRGPALQRRVMEQQEDVVMPGNHAVDRAAVQFGSMGLNGDVDEEREEPETRPQPPQHSPVAPRASLPPSTQAHAPTDNVAVPRPAPGLPPAPASAAEAQFNEFGRYAEAQKPYDPFGQQLEQPQPQAQEPFSNQASIPGQPVATSAADYSAFYGGDQSRNPYYYGSYGQSQEAAQRPGAGFGVSGADMQPQLASTQPPSRYAHAEASTSGHTTPNPTVPAQAQQAQPSQHMPQAQGGHGFNYYPYYSSPHYANTYMNQMGGQHQYGRNRPMYDDARRYEDHYLHGNQFGYNSQFAGPYAKGGMYGQPQHGFSYDHASSPANAGGFQNIPGRESSYGRTGSAQPSEAQQTAGHTAFGGIGDVFGRGQSGYGQAPPIAQQQPVSAEESAKGFDATKAGGPSPSLAQVNRPGSATNSAPGQPQAVQGGLPPVPNQQGFAGGYPLNPQYSGLGGLGGHASQTHHQAGAYGNYGGFGSNNYYGSTGRGGGWGGNYGH